MARFKTLREKEKRYVFDFLENRKDPQPAAVVFARLPLPDEDFMPRVKGSVFDSVDFGKLASKDNKEMDKMVSVFMDHFSKNITKVDFEYFARECFSHFENFESDGKQIKTVDDFLSLNIEMRTLIANDCYRYAQEKDEFTMGE
ncbi:MAG: hypothetical protein FWD91_08510 [Treponema sp.]|nr:hypothetical protein [Treponema sp.]